MKLLRFYLIAIAACAVGNAISAAPPTRITCGKDVRKMSRTDNTLFHDVLNGLGGVGMIDAAGFPRSTSREMSKIEVVVPNDNHGKGVERWTVKHDGGEVASYLISFVPDGQGGSYFSVRREKVSPELGPDHSTEPPPSAVH